MVKLSHRKRYNKIITFEKQNAKQYIFSAGALSNKNIINALLLT